MALSWSSAVLRAYGDDSDLQVSSDARPRNPFLMAARSIMKAEANGIILSPAIGLRFSRHLLTQNPPRSSLINWIRASLTRETKFADLLGAFGHSDRLAFPPGLSLELGTRTLGETAHHISIRHNKADEIVENVAIEAGTAIVERSMLLGDWNTDNEVHCLLRFTALSYLSLGARLAIARIDSSGYASIVNARLSNQGQISFSIDSIIVDEVCVAVARLSQCWRCAFDAIFVLFDGQAHLVDLFLSNRAADMNLEELVQKHQNTRQKQLHIGLNIAHQKPKPLVGNSEVLLRVTPYGQRRGKGHIVLSIDHALAMHEIGGTPILFVDSIRPTDAGILPRLSGLVLVHDGPASHITVLARTSGVPVLSQASHVQFTTTSTILIGNVILHEGDAVTIDEGTGCLYAGDINAQLLRSNADVVNDVIKKIVGTSVVMTTSIPCSGTTTPGVPGTPVGLCRSEMQLYGSLQLSAFQNYLRIANRANEPSEVPSALSDHLERELRSMLAAAQGAMVNYRLMDASLHEVWQGEEPEKGGGGTSIEVDLTERMGTSKFFARDTGFGIRGPRWGVRTGFYEWQIQMAVKTAHEVSLTMPVDLIITVPAACSYEEVAFVRSLYDRVMAEIGNLKSQIRFGVMIETPRLCMTASRLASVGDVFCFGLNDLTQFTFGIGRESWSELSDYYIASGFVDADPFRHLDVLGVGALLRKAIGQIRTFNPKAEFIVCGAAASSEQAMELLSDEKQVRFSVDPDALSIAELALAKVRSSRRWPGLWLPNSIGSVFSDHAIVRMRAARLTGRLELARQIALDWSQAFRPLSALGADQNWKIFKKVIVRTIFGEPEGRYFYAGWKSVDVVEYAYELLVKELPARVSVFPNTISCHSRSESLSNLESKEELIALVEGIDRESTLHVFPEQSCDQMCFRLIFDDCFFLIEAGWGQAMYVFEAERGAHETIIATGRVFGPIDIQVMGNVSPRLVDALRCFTDKQYDWICSIVSWLPIWFGVTEIAIEGYYDSKSGNCPVIVDMDLPADVAWN